jgi:FlaA1/EpsC-like NDP-sugar epimerase
MFAQLRNFNFYVIFFLDLILFSAALFSAYLVRFEFILDRSDIAQILFLLPYVLVIKVIIFFFMGLYKGMFRYAGISDLWKLCRATVLSTLVIIVVMLIANRFQGYSRAVFLIDGGLTFLFAGGLGVIIRLILK